MQQNEGWEEEEPGAGITSSAWSGAHGSLGEDTRKAFPNGETPSPLPRSQLSSPGVFTTIFLSLSIAYPDCTLTPILGCSNSKSTRNLYGGVVLDGRGRPALVQNPKLRRRASPGVRRGYPAGRPGPTRRRLSALRGGWLPFEHGFDDKRNRLFDGASWKVGRPLAQLA